MQTPCPTLGKPVALDAADEVVRLQSVRKAYGSHRNAVIALAGVTIAFERASFTAVMGPSGSGKSTRAFRSPSECPFADDLVPLSGLDGWCDLWTWWEAHAHRRNGIWSSSPGVTFWVGHGKRSGTSSSASRAGTERNWLELLETLLGPFTIQELAQVGTDASRRVTGGASEYTMSQNLDTQCLR